LQAKDVKKHMQFYGCARRLNFLSTRHVAAMSPRISIRLHLLKAQEEHDVGMAEMNLAKE
jgi:hypothetical protein